MLSAGVGASSFTHRESTLGAFHLRCVALLVLAEVKMPVPTMLPMIRATAARRPSVPAELGALASTLAEGSFDTALPHECSLM
jgi:hypothetical protein